MRWVLGAVVIMVVSIAVGSFQYSLRKSRSWRDYALPRGAKTFGVQGSGQGNSLIVSFRYSGLSTAEEVYQSVLAVNEGTGKTTIGERQAVRDEPGRTMLITLDSQPDTFRLVITKKATQ